MTSSLARAGITHGIELTFKAHRRDRESVTCRCACATSSSSSSSVGSMSEFSSSNKSSPITPLLSLSDGIMCRWKWAVAEVYIQSMNRFKSERRERKRERERERWYRAHHIIIALTSRISIMRKRFLLPSLCRT